MVAAAAVWVEHPFIPWKEKKNPERAFLRGSPDVPGSSSRSFSSLCLSTVVMYSSWRPDIPIFVLRRVSSILYRDIASWRIESVWQYQDPVGRRNPRELAWPPSTALAIAMGGHT